MRGRTRVPGDKSISHRALMFNAMASGTAQVTGLLDSADVRSTAQCLRAMGVRIDSSSGGEVVVHGRDGRLDEPADVLDCGNSGTTMRLLTGLLAGQSGHFVLTGDDSLRGRPMDRVAQPLAQLGARIHGREGGRLAPLSIQGDGGLRGAKVQLNIASAQVRTAMLLAALQAKGSTELSGNLGGRDHSRRMLGSMGAAIRKAGQTLLVEGCRPLRAVDVAVPGDISSAAFLIVAASVVPGSELRIEGVGLNPTRTGVLDALGRMGAAITVEDATTLAGEPIGTLCVRHAPLHGIDIGGAEVPRLIDELPVLAVAAACAQGTTRVRDAAELRVKESDRIATTLAMLAAVGAQAQDHPDGFDVTGGRALGSGVVHANGDHRIAMAGAVLGLVATGGVEVRGADAVDVSFPGFGGLVAGLRDGQ